MLRTYPSVYALGHKAITELLLDPVVVQEKVDGSQFSFGLLDGVLHMRSKGAVVDPRSHDKMFAGAVETVCKLQERGLLEDGWTYRAEVLAKPKHNTLCYARVPVGNLVLFDIVFGTDVMKEETDYIKDVLIDYFWKDISRGVVRGLPEWYKEKLARNQPVRV